MSAPAPSPPRRSPRTLAWVAGALVVLALLAGLVLLLGLGGDGGSSPSAGDARGGERALEPGGTAKVTDAEITDPLDYDPDRQADYERRAAAGFSHPLFAQSPGGAPATAQRTARWRKDIEAAAKDAGVQADTLEAIVFLESAGRPDAIAGGDVAGAAGLTQILSGTGSGVLGMRIDLAASKALTRRIARAERRGDAASAARLAGERRRVDERFVPRRALAATARYLAVARDELPDREDLLVASYHMGIGNLQEVLRRYGHSDVPYAQLYFDSSPLRHAGTWRKLASLGDDSASYWFRILAAREIMRLWREDPDALRRIAALQTAKNSSEELLHPSDDTKEFDTPAELRRARNDGDLLRLPVRAPRAGLRADKGIGELARGLGQSPDLYRALRPEALSTLGYLGYTVRRISGDRRGLVVTSTVRDQTYQRVLIGRNAQATRNFSLHTTGYAVDIRRSYTSRAQALAFQFVLDRLRALNLLAYVVEPGAIHFTASSEAETLEGWMDRLGLT